MVFLKKCNHDKTDPKNNHGETNQPSKTVKNMALESVFGTPPPVVGAVLNKEHTMKHGEKQSDDSMADIDPDKEEGEIEDGEIIDSGEEEEGIAANNGPTVVHFTRMVAGLHPDLENEIEAMGALKKKKKKKKKRKRPLVALDGENGGVSENEDTTPPKSKKHKLRYVDHDRVDDDGMWFGGGKKFNHRNEQKSVEPFIPFDSPNLVPLPQDIKPVVAPPPTPPPPKRSPSRSPPGLYDSPRESSGDEFNGLPSGDRSGGGGMYGKFPNSNFDGLGSDFGRRKKSNKGGKGGKGGKRRKGDKRGKGRSKQNKRKESRRQICKFYLDGKCQKGEECGYSHDQPQTKKMELCKFYLNGFCHKADTCVYMHKDFPCKFFHTGAKCYSADNCKFSHDELTEELRWVLEKYLDKEDDGGNSDCSIPKHHRPSLLGSPPRHIKEMAAQEALKKIPSLFDIEVEPPPTITPPSGPPQPSRPNFYSETLSPPGPNRPALLPYPTSTFDPDPGDFPFDEDIRQPFGKMGGPGGPTNEPCFGIGSNGGNMPPKYCGDPHSMLEPQMQDIDDRFPPMMDEKRRFKSGQDFDDDNPGKMGRKRGRRNSNDMQSFNPAPWRNQDVDMRSRPHLAMDSEVENLVSNDWDEETAGDRDKSQSSESENDNRKFEANSHFRTDGSGMKIPLHLPKKQRELFLRIQQQQRQADSSQEDSDKGDWKKPEVEDINTELIVSNKWDEEAEDEEEKAVKKAETERWYSSDEDDSDDEDRPLTAVLKKLQQEPIQKQSSQPSLFNITQMLQSITGVKPPSLTTMGLEFPLGKLDAGRDPRGQRSTDFRDPRNSRNVDLRDPRARMLRDPRFLPLGTPPEVPLPLRDPRLHFSSSDSNSVDDLKFPSTKEPKSPGIVTVKTEPWSDLDGENRTPSKTAVYHPVPYRLRAMPVSQSVYTSVAQSIQLDPKLFNSDPRLRRQLMSDPRLCRSPTLLSACKKLEQKDTVAESKDAPGDVDEAKTNAKKDILLPRFAQRRPSEDKESALDVKVDVKQEILLPQFGRRMSEGRESPEVVAATDVKPDIKKEILPPRFGHHRLGAITVPCTPRDAPKIQVANNVKAAVVVATPSPEANRSPDGTADDEKIPFEPDLESSDDDSSDDLVIIESTVKEDTDDPVILEAKIVKSPKPSAALSDEPVIVLESGAPRRSPKADVPYKRRSSMDYASPLGYGESDSANTSSGYDRKPSPKTYSTSGAKSPVSADGKLSKTQLVSSIPPSPPSSSDRTNPPSPPGANNPKSLPPLDNLDDNVETMDNTSLKDIFKTIDPTASPFC